MTAQRHSPVATVARRLASAWLLASLGALIHACAPSHDGRLMLVVTSDIPADTLATVQIAVGAESRELAVGPGAASVPLSLVIEATPGRAAGQPVTITASALAADRSVLVSRPVTTTFLPNRTIVLTIDLARRCTPLAGCTEQLRCAPGEACTASGCVSPAIDATTLPDLRNPGDEIGASTSYTAAETCAAFAEVYCGGILRCCPAVAMYTPEEIETLRAQCRTSYDEYCASTLVPLLSDPRTGFDPVRAAAAMNEGTRLAATCDLTYADWTVSFERGIYSALRGSIAPGDRCSLRESADFFACRDGACLPSGPLMLACAPRACLDDVCSGDYPLADYGCGDGLYCARNATNFTCERRLADGEECTRDTQCASQICDEVTDAEGMLLMPGHCQPRSRETVFCPPAPEM